MATIADKNFTGLRTSIGDWLHRNDLTNTDLGNFIFLAEAEFNTEMRNRNMEARTTIGVTSGYLPHPSDWQEWKTITLVQGSQRFALDPISEEVATMLYGQAADDTMPRGYVVQNGRTYIYPSQAVTAYTYETVYFQGIPNLSGSVTTNWMLNQYPQGYLFASLLQATGFGGDDDRVGLWKSGRDEALDKIDKASKRASYSGGIPQMRPDRVF